MYCEGGIGEDLPKLKAQSTSCNYTQIRKAISLYTQTHVKPYMPYMQAHQSLSSCLVFCFVSPCPHAWCLSLGSAAFAAWQRLLVCVARKYLYTCTDAFALPSTALRHHSSTIYMHTRICLAQHGTRANAPIASCCCMHAVERSLNAVACMLSSRL